MCVVAISSLLASVAIPAFGKFIRESKTAEANTMLRTIYDAEAAHFLRITASRADRAGKEFFDWQGAACNFTTGPLCHAFTYSTAYDAATGMAPRGRKAILTFYPAPGTGYDPVVYDWYKAFPTIGVTFDSASFFSYYSIPGAADVAAVCYNPGLFTYWTSRLEAHGDLDGDGIESTFMRIIYVDQNGEVSGGGGIYSANPLE
jgi:type II secretory pathway pseudopilin PulG